MSNVCIADGTATPLDMSWLQTGGSWDDLLSTYFATQIGADVRQPASDAIHPSIDVQGTNTGLGKRPSDLPDTVNVLGLESKPDTATDNNLCWPWLQGTTRQQSALAAADVPSRGRRIAAGQYIDNANDCAQHDAFHSMLYSSSAPLPFVQTTDPRFDGMTSSSPSDNPLSEQPLVASAFRERALSSSTMPILSSTPSTALSPSPMLAPTLSPSQSTTHATTPVEELELEKGTTSDHDDVFDWLLKICLARQQAGNEARETIGAPGATIRVHSKSQRNGTERATKRRKKDRAASFTISDRILSVPQNRFSYDSWEVTYPDELNLAACAASATGPSSSHDGVASVVKNDLDSIAAKMGKGSSTNLYTPRWTCGDHKGRYGWCHLCPEGGWYSMKRSQYLYHLQYHHGVSSITKTIYDPPRAMRTWDDPARSTEGLCPHCELWISISHGPVRKPSFKCYFTHAHTCHPR